MRSPENEAALLSPPPLGVGSRADSSAGSRTSVRITKLARVGAAAGGGAGWRELCGFGEGDWVSREGEKKVGEETAEGGNWDEEISPAICPVMNRPPCRRTQYVSA